MPSPLNRDPARPPLFFPPIDQPHNLQRPRSRETPTTLTRHNQHPRPTLLPDTPRTQRMRNRTPPIIRRVVRHQLPIPPPIAFHRLSKEKRLVGAPRLRLRRWVAGLRVRAVPETGGDGAAVGGGGVGDEGFLHGGESGGVVAAAVAVRGTPVGEVVLEGCLVDVDLVREEAGREQFVVGPGTGQEGLVIMCVLRWILAVTIGLRRRDWCR
jgi:hypothetical protein